MTGSSDVPDLALRALSNFTSADTKSFEGLTCDAGPAILAALCSGRGDGNADEIAGAALSAWLDWCQRASYSVGLFGGLAGMFTGVHMASSVVPQLVPLASQLRDVLTDDALVKRWQATAVEWQHYDLISGPSGTILALTTDRACRPLSILPAARHLATLCDRQDLSRLRVGGYREDKLRSWNCGRINTGLAHGVGGVISALRSASEIDHTLAKELKEPLRRACQWLVDESYVDERGLQTWSVAALEGAPAPRGARRRQAWCYGTPGLAWTLWEAGRVLEEPALTSFAEDAMCSFCAVFDDRFYIDDGPADDALGICHGAAGTLAIADAFAVHASLAKAKELAAALQAYLFARTDKLMALAETNMTLLTGASGILAVLLVRAGRQRDWLAQLGLR